MQKFFPTRFIHGDADQKSTPLHISVCPGYVLKRSYIRSGVSLFSSNENFCMCAGKFFEANFAMNSTWKLTEIYELSVFS